MARLKNVVKPNGPSPADTDAAQSDEVFATAAELFALLATPIRLKILSALCNGEKNVSQLLGEIDTTQPNMSQHLATLYRAGIIGRRRDSTQIYYCVQSQQAVAVCRSVCTQIAFDLDEQATTTPVLKRAARKRA